MQLNAVVFPDPLGPISPKISPSLTSNDTSLSAVNPPKRLVRFVTVSIGGGRWAGAARCGPRRALYLAASGDDAGRGSRGEAVATVLG